MSVCPDPRWSKWWTDFVKFNDAGRHPALRPKTLPKRIPERAWDCYFQLKRSRPKPAVVIPFTPPIAFYRAPNDLTVGITEALDVFKGDIAIDPLQGVAGVWADIVRAARVRGRKVYGWTRVYDYGTWQAYMSCAAPYALDGSFPNIEDDDLRGKLDVEHFLFAVANNRLPNEPPLCGVLTNYNVSDLWPPFHPLSHLPVLPEIFPREITDPTWTLEGSLDSGRRHFAAALPLLDGRERGLEAFNYPVGALCIWPADSVENWKGWVR